MSENTLGEVYWDALNATWGDLISPTPYAHLPEDIRNRTEKAARAVAAHVANPDAAECDSAAEIMADSLLRDILEAVCQRDGLSLESAVEPGRPARNYELAGRLGIGGVFDLKPAPELAAAIAVKAAPGDVVVIAPGRPLDPDEARQIGEAFADAAPGVGVIIGLDVEALEVRRPDAPATVTEPQPAPDSDSQQRYIDQLHDLVRDMLEAFPDTADEQAWRDRAGRLYVHDHDGQPYRAYTEDDL